MSDASSSLIAVPGAARSVIRWKVLVLLFSISFIAYIYRTNMSVAGKFMSEEFGLSQVQLGWVLNAFILGYTLGQFPGGILGERMGARRILMIACVLWSALTIATGLIPGTLITGAGTTLIALLLIRFLMGLAQGPLYPVFQGAVESWFPVGRWALPSALGSTGLTLGAAATPPIVTWVIVNHGWRESFYVTVPLGLILAAVWWWYARDDPGEHRSVESAELALIRANRLAEEADAHSTGAWKKALMNRDILIVSTAYLCMNYVFYIFFSWFFIYLVDVRGFTILEGGLAASAPWICGAVGATVGGEVCDRLCKRLGPVWGCRLPITGGLLVVAGCLVAGTLAPNPMVAIVFLSLCFGFTQFTEGSFWSGTTFIGRRHTATATGILNTFANAGGLIATPMIPFLAAQFNWLVALMSGAGFAVLGALLCLFVRFDKPMPQ